ncbi:MAG: type II secretion system minor pseudopilin GspI [Rhodothalassiaceae bacterium]
MTIANRSLGHGGFTLVEVLVALFLFALASAALVTAQTQQARTAAGLEMRYFAQVVAENELLRATAGPVPERGIARGETDMAAYRFAWARAVADTPLPGVLRVDISVTVAGDDQPVAAITGLRRAQ